MGAFDHQEWTYDGAFEQLFGLGRREFEQKFSKNSNAREVGDVEASIWLVHNVIFVYFLLHDYNLKTYNCEIFSFLTD